MVNVFFCKNSPLWNPEVELEKISKLPEDLRNKIRQYQSAEDRQLRIRSKYLLLESLTKLGFQRKLSEIKYDAFGKPFFVEGPYFNISHAGDLVVCVMSSVYQVGIDTEVLGGMNFDEYVEFLSADIFASCITATEKNIRFLEYWTGYESAAKAMGKGLYIPITEVEISNSVAIVEGEKWFLKSINLSESNFTTVAVSQFVQYVEVAEVNI